jgi:hypothetical protein
MDFGTLALWYLAIFSGLIVYMVPTLIAIVRKHEKVGLIGTLNVLVGWTVIGWIAAMVWTFSDR